MECSFVLELYGIFTTLIYKLHCGLTGCLFSRHAGISTKEADNLIQMAEIQEVKEKLKICTGIPPIYSIWHAGIKQFINLPFYNIVLIFLATVCLEHLLHLAHSLPCNTGQATWLKCISNHPGEWYISFMLVLFDRNVMSILADFVARGQVYHGTWNACRTKMHMKASASWWLDSTELQIETFVPTLCFCAFECAHWTTPKQKVMLCCAGHILTDWI